MEDVWYVFYCSSRAEKKVSERLSGLGYSVFLPLHGTLKQWSDRKKWVQEPLFPGYVFVRCPSDKIAAVAGVQGVVAAVRLAGKPAYINRREVEAINRYLLSGFHAEVTEQTFAAGDRVRVTEGPLKDMEGLFLHMEGKDFLCIVLESFNHMLKIHLHAGKVTKIA